MTAFFTLTVLPAAQLANLNELGYLSMTPVQAAALPAILVGKDVRVQAKPAAEKRPPSGWVCCSISIRRALRPVAGAVSDPRTGGSGCRRAAPSGALPAEHQDFDALRRAAVWRPARFTAARPAYYRRHPGRLLDHLQKGTVSLDVLQTLVMDEADRMLDMGFSDAIDEVIRFAPADRQTLLFSATACGNRGDQRPGAASSGND